MTDLLSDSFLGFFHQLPLAAQIVELHGEDGLRVLAANEASERVLGLGPAAVGAALEDRLPSLVRAGVVAVGARAARSDEGGSLDEARIEGAGGGVRVMSVKAFPLGGGRAGLVYEDIGARKAAEEREARGAHAAYRAIFDCVPDIVFVKRAADETYVHWNKTCAEFTGVSTESAVGKRLKDLFPDDIAARLDAADRSVLAERKAIFFEEVMPSPRGPRLCHTTKVPILSDDGRPLYLVGVSQDMTERKVAEDELQKRSAELHETRTNLLETIRELSTPVLPIHDGILVVPLVGHMDSERSGQLTDALLTSIQRHQAETVIIDITGLDLIDTAVASHLIQATRAAALLGTECVLVGIAPSIARTLVQLGVDFGLLTTRRDLQAGVAYALGQRSLDAR